MENELGEATVIATKVKMVIKGNAIVYNADAFELANGSILDKLIEKLSGISLDRNGQIYVNGEDFFQGAPKYALKDKQECCRCRHTAPIFYVPD